MKEPIPDSYKKLTFYNWDGVYYYHHKPCEKVKDIIVGNIIDIFNDYPYGNFYIHDTGYIKGKTLSGTVNLKFKL